jgi:hypothetical protein
MAQNAYNFTQYQDSYTPIENGDTINSKSWNDECWTLFTPFDLSVFGYSVDNWCAKEGTIRANSLFGMDTINFAISAFSADLRSSNSDPSSSPIIQDISGPEGKRILTIEYRNAHFEYLNGMTAFVNFQILYYERDKIIEFHFGPSEVESAKQAYNDRRETFGGLIGMARGNEELILEGLFLGGNPNNIIEYGDSELMEGFPNDGTVYRFVPENVSSTATHADACLELIEQHHQNIFEIRTKATHVSIINLNGQLIKSLNTKSGIASISRENLPKGILIISAYGCTKAIKMVNL